MPYIEPDLRKFEKKVHSQFGEDGVLEVIASNLGIAQGTFFEFGIGPEWGKTIESGLEGNFVLLAKRGWQGVFLDGTGFPEHGVRREFITAMNINDLYRKHALPADLDFMSIDVDGQEFWIWMALQHRPKVVVVEINGSLDIASSKTVQFDLDFKWDGTMYHGASLRAMNKLAESKSYVLVYSNGVNAIFIRGDLVTNRNDFDMGRLFSPFPSFPADPKERPWVLI